MAEERITDGYKDSADIEWEAEKICRWAASTEVQAQKLAVFIVCK